MANSTPEEPRSDFKIINFDGYGIGTKPAGKTFPLQQTTITFKSEVGTAFGILFHRELGAQPPRLTVPAMGEASVTLNPTRTGGFVSQNGTEAVTVCPTCQSKLPVAEVLFVSGADLEMKASREEGEPIIIID